MARGRQGRQAKSEESKERKRQKKEMKRHRRHRGNRQGGDQQGGDRPQRGDYDLGQKSNAAFESYYKGLGIVPEEEWNDFIEALQKPLPVTFRITGFRGQSKELLKIIKGEYLNDLLNTGDMNAEVAPKCLNWYPDELAWQINLSRKEVRKDERLEKLKKFLIFETESGNLSRQEAVSMLPPLLMDVKPHHKVLDMCAAPGSKTGQLIEYLHATEANREPEGFVVANDVDNKRCYLMVHQVKRLQSACCVIINHDATILPNMRNGDGYKDFIKYDRVLCDVPCSGDGTLRKNVDIWNKWTGKQAVNLHKMQYMILKRGLEQLAVGGRCVYSTCSLNPVEDEAVINSILELCEGAVELADVSQNLPGLKYAPGLLSWKLMTNKDEWYETYEQARGNPELKGLWHLRPTMFPPSMDQAKERQLNRCIRVLPHLQDTGGFFIAVLQKTKELKWLRPVAEKVIETDSTSSEVKDTSVSTDVGQTENVTPEENKQNSKDPVVTNNNTENSTGAAVNEQATQSCTGQKDTETQQTESITDGKSQTQPDNPNKRKHEGHPRLEHKKMRGYKEDPFIFLKPEDGIWPAIKEFYGISDSFCEFQVLGRTETGKRKQLYYVSAAIKDMLERNKDRIKFINTGVKMFGRSPSPLVPTCDFRISTEGLNSLIGHTTARTVILHTDDMITLLRSDNPFISKFSKNAADQLKQIVPGSMIFKYEPVEGESGPSCDIAVCGWRGKISVRCFVSKPDRTHFLRFFGLELDDILKQLEEEKRAAREREEEMNITSSDDEKELDTSQDNSDATKRLTDTDQDASETAKCKTGSDSLAASADLDIGDTVVMDKIETEDNMCKSDSMEVDSQKLESVDKTEETSKE